MKANLIPLLLKNIIKVKINEVKLMKTEKSIIRKKNGYWAWEAFECMEGIFEENERVGVTAFFPLTEEQAIEWLTELGITDFSKDYYRIDHLENKL